MSNTTRAQEVLQALVHGNDPDTDEPLLCDSVLNRTEVRRALLTGLSALQVLQIRDQRRAQLPANVGKSWTQDEEQTLIAAFKSRFLHSSTAYAIASEKAFTSDPNTFKNSDRTSASSEVISL